MLQTIWTILFITAAASVVIFVLMLIYIVVYGAIAILIELCKNKTEDAPEQETEKIETEIDLTNDSYFGPKLERAQYREYHKKRRAEEKNALK